MSRVTYTKQTVLEILRHQRENLVAQMDVLRKERTAGAEEVIDVFTESIDHRGLAANKITDLYDAANAFDNAMTGNDLQVKITTMLELKKVIEDFPKGFFHRNDGYTLEKALKDSPAEKNQLGQISTLDARIRLIEQTEGDSFYLTSLEKLGVLKYFK